MVKSTFGRTIAALVMVVAFTGTTTLMAQTRARIGIGGGGSPAVGSFGDVFNTGWHGQVMALFNLPALPFDIRVDGQYGEHKDDLTGSVKTKLLTGMVGAQFNFGAPAAPAKPYLTGGVGVTNVDISSALGSGSTTELAAGAGAGVGFRFGAVSLFLETRVMNAFMDGGDITFIPISGGIMFGGR